MRNMNCPDTWDRLLNIVRPIFGETAIIAGGCIRDFDLGVQPKDIDIFVGPQWGDDDGVFGMTPVFIERCEQLTEHLGDYDNFDLTVHDLAEMLAGHPNKSEYDSWSQGKLTGLAEGQWTTWMTNGKGIDYEFAINIIERTDLTADAEAFIMDFDADVCRAYYKAKAPERSKAYLRDIQCGTYTITKDPSEFPSALRRYDRFNQRHPRRLRLVDPYAPSRHAAE